MRLVFVIMLLILSIVLFVNAYFLYKNVINSRVFDTNRGEHLTYFLAVEEPMEGVWLFDMCGGAACCLAGAILSFWVAGLRKWIFLALFGVVALVFYYSMSRV